jgi:hypothetical protein
MKKWFAFRNLLLVLVAIFLLIQLVPTGRYHTNPPVQSEPNWDSPDTRTLAKTACFDCHSNETDWSRWYVSVAPASWLVQHDVDEGRQFVNFSEWNQGGRPREPEELWEVLQRSSMPPSQYVLLHPEARLTQTQVNHFITGLRQTVAY